MRTVTLACVCLAFSVLMLSCQGFTGASKEAAITVLTDLLAKGTITQEQYDALLAAFSGGGWSKALEIAGTIGGSVLTTLLAVLGWRGGVTKRKGTAAPVA